MTNCSDADKQTALFPVVAAALIDPAGKVLVQRRPLGKSMGGLWEFPGGKLEHGETPALALVRELQEELGIVVDPADLMAAAFASEPLADKHLLLLLYICRRWSGDVQALEATELRWVVPSGLAALPMPPADRPLVSLLQKLV